MLKFLLPGAKSASSATEEKEEKDSREDEKPQIILNDDENGALVTYHRYFVVKSDADEIFKSLLNPTEFDYQFELPLLLYNKVCLQNRGVALLAVDPSIQIYRYSGNTELRLQPMPMNIQKLMTEINLLLKTEFNAALVNYYRNGRDSIGMHSDSKQNLSSNSQVGAVSFGTDRFFDLQHKTTKAKIRTIVQHG